MSETASNAGSLATTATRQETILDEMTTATQEFSQQEHAVTHHSKRDGESTGSILRTDRNGAGEYARRPLVSSRWSMNVAGSGSAVCQLQQSFDVGFSPTVAVRGFDMHASAQFGRRGPAQRDDWPRPPFPGDGPRCLRL